VNGGLLLPLHLGWWGFQSFNPPQIEPTYPDVMENLGAKLIGWDAGISLTAGIDRETLRTTPLFRRAVETLRVCEELRGAKEFDEATKAKLRESGQEFAMFKDSAGKTRFRRVQSAAQTVVPAEPWTLGWQVTNAFAEQPVNFRIEALMSAASGTDTNVVVLAELGKPDSGAWKSTSADGVSFALKPAGSGDPAGCVLTATNSGKVARRAAWVRLEKSFSPPLNMKERQGLSLEIEGDGSGALVAVRLESPRAIAYGAVADRYVMLDFTGRRSFTLVETESTRWSDYVWNDGKGAYNVYRETIDFGAIESVGVWLQNLPPGRETKCRLGPIRALPLRAGTVTNPKLTVGGKTVEFPIKLASGSWIECRGPEDCAAYGPKGESLGKVTPKGAWPMLMAGPNTLQFSTEASDGCAPRGRVTVFCQGEGL
jgi:hypothetical protein